MELRILIATFIAKEGAWGGEAETKVPQPPTLGIRSLVDQITPSTALDVLHHPPRAGDEIHPALRREWSDQQD